jgi:hypothetical protein
LSGPVGGDGAAGDVELSPVVDDDVVEAGEAAAADVEGGGAGEVVVVQLDIVVVLRLRAVEGTRAEAEEGIVAGVVGGELDPLVGVDGTAGDGDAEAEGVRVAVVEADAAGDVERAIGGDIEGGASAVAAEVAGGDRGVDGDVTAARAGVAGDVVVDAAARRTVVKVSLLLSVSSRVLRQLLSVQLPLPPCQR